MDLLHKDLCDKIIKSFYTVYNTLGYGFLEKVYENALKIEFKKQGLKVIYQMPIKVYYEKEIIGEYYSDFCIENKIIVELKALDKLSEAHEAQLINYLTATGFEVGLLLNFGLEPQFKRKIFTHNK
jgi:GxxExxY protein